MRTGPLSAVFLLGLACGSAAEAAPLLPDAPRLSLEFEAQFAQPDDTPTQGFGAAFWAAYRFTDQLAATGAVSTLVSRGGPFSTLGAGIRGVIDITPIQPFLDVQIAVLGPEDNTHYTLATRLGGGADCVVAQGFSLGLAVRALTPVNGAASESQGIEVSFRLVLTPALIQ